MRSNIVESAQRRLRGVLTEIAHPPAAGSASATRISIVLET
jgi:hypothetical protein